MLSTVFFVVPMIYCHIACEMDIHWYKQIDNTNG